MSTKVEPKRIVWLDDGPYIATAARPCASYTCCGEVIDAPYGYMAAHVIRRATVDEVEAWRAGEGEV